MNQLKEVTFINSATLPFAQIDVGENTLFSGGNGAGKTTILRSILYFYGAQRSEHLGISRKKKRFEEYYFASINSYLVYKFENEDADVYAIMYKAGGLRVKYRFAIEQEKEDIKTLFFDGNVALEPKALWTRLLEKGFELSPVLNTPKEYKSVLYGQDRKLAHFSFFRANSEYEQISKTLSNVFINSKLDSGSIKKSLVSSISGFAPIELNQMRRNLGDFRTKYDDISSFEKNSAFIHEAVSSLGLYEQQDQELQDNAKALGANAKVAESGLESYTSQSLVLKEELQALKESFESKQTQYQEEHDAALKEQGALEKEIEQSLKKEAEYEKANIKAKLQQWHKKPLLEDEILALKAQLAKLLDSQGSLSERFSAMKEQELRSFQDKEQKLKSEITEIDQHYTHKRAELIEQEQSEYAAYEVNKQERSKHLQEQLNRAKEEALSAQTQESIVQNRSFDKEKIDKAKVELHRAERAFDEEKAALQLAQSQGKMIAEQVYSAEQTKSFNLQNLNHEFEKQTQHLNAQIDELKKRQNLDAASLLGFMHEEGFENTALLSALLKDEVLYREDLHPIIEGKNDTLLGLAIDKEKIDCSAYEKGALNISLQACEERLKKMRSEHNLRLEELENETRNSINALRREQGRINTLVDEHLRTLPKLEQESLRLAEELQTLQNLAAKKKDQELSYAREQKSAKESALQIVQTEFDTMLQGLQESFEEIKASIHIKRQTLDREHQEALAEKEHARSRIEDECDAKLESIKAQEDEALLQGGVDKKLLKKYQDEIDQKNKELSSIEALEELISEYRIDQKRVFDHIDTKKEALKLLCVRMEEKTKTFNALKADFITESESLQERHSRCLSQLSAQQKDLKEYLSFKESRLYQDVHEWIEGSDFEPNDESLSDMINRLRDLGFEHASTKEKLRKKLNRAFSSISLHNIFNLYAPSSDSDSDILASANALKTFVLENKIDIYKEEVAKEFTLTLRHLSSEIKELLKAEGDISKTVSRINKTLQDLHGIKVIRGIELRYKESDNLLLNVLKAIGELVDENPYGNEINLFSAEINEQFNQKALKYLDELALHLSEEKADMLTLDESFVLEFRAIENGNDTGFVPSLDGIGSNGTDVMVKAMVNIAMLSLARKQSSKQEASVYFHCILDEVGILSPAYLKELIAYANNKKIRFVNGAPDEKLVSTYKRLYMLSTNAKHQTIVRKLLSQS